MRGGSAPLRKIEGGQVIFSKSWVKDSFPFSAPGETSKLTGGEGVDANPDLNQNLNFDTCCEGRLSSFLRESDAPPQKIEGGICPLCPHGSAAIAFCA